MTYLAFRWDKPRIAGAQLVDFTSCSQCGAETRLSTNVMLAGLDVYECGWCERISDAQKRITLLVTHSETTRVIYEALDRLRFAENVG